jgi:hypothetical protein
MGSNAVPELVRISLLKPFGPPILHLMLDKARTFLRLKPLAANDDVRVLWARANIALSIL